MSSVFLLLARPLLDALLSAFGRTLLDMLGTWQARSDAMALGRATANSDVAKRTAEAIAAMGDVSELSDDEMLERLREGKA